MPPIEVDDLHDVAVLWESMRYNRYGRIEVEGTPVEIPCRWVENVVSTGGNQEDLASVVAQIYTDRYLGLSSVLWHGSLANLPSPLNFERESDSLLEVSDSHVTPDLDGREYRYSSDLKRFRDVLPETV